MKSIFADDGNLPHRLRWGIFVFLAVLMLAVPQAALLPLIDRDEPRFAEASREMLQTGNVVVPMFNGEPRYAKPPLIYWCQAAALRLCGENAFAARLPSLLATAGTALILYLWGLEIWGLGTGLIAAFAYGLCFQTIQQGRVATADALMIFFVALTGFAGWKLLELARNGKFFRIEWHLGGVLLALGFAGGFLAKGPETMLPLLPLLYGARRMGAGVIAALVAIFLLGLLLVAAWAIPAYVQTHGEYWSVGLKHDVGERMVSGFEGHGGSSWIWYVALLPFYLVLFWLSALPWSPLLVKRRRELFRNWPLDETDVYLLSNAALFFLVFTFMVTKLPHYTLPAFPFLALALGKRWIETGLDTPRPVHLMLAAAFWFAMATIVVVPLALLGANPSPTGVLVREAGAALKPETQVAMVDFDEPNVVWESRRIARPFVPAIPVSRVGDFLRMPGPRAVVLRTATWTSLHLSDPAWQTFSADGWNSARLTRLGLTMVVKP